MILGIDEVGRGPWAGPLVVGAVVLGTETIEGLTDSKKLTKKRREALDAEIRTKASGIGMGWVHAHEIDQVGLSEALRMATIRAVEQIAAPYHEIIIDGTINFLKETTKGRYVTTMKKADLLIPSVSAASIIAKVARDNYMADQDNIFPGYGFASHVGYGTAAHIKAIDQLGVTELHRLSFAPLAKYRTRGVARKQIILRRENLADSSLHSAELAKAQTSSNGKELSARFSGYDDSVSLASPPRSTKKVGDAAEELVAEYLTADGHVIIARNWRTKFCEIDIVSRNGSAVYFTEVKYRKTARQGGGFAAITVKKRQQMTFAAELYATKNRLANADLRLMVAELVGNATKPHLLELE